MGVNTDDKLNCVALRLIRFSDTQSVLTTYSLERGKIALLLNTGNSPSARRLKALVMPLNTFSCRIVGATKNKDLYRVADVMGTNLHLNLHMDPVRIMEATFMADVIAATITNVSSEPLLYEFLNQSIQELATIEKGRQNYHLLFMLRLGHFLGIAPDTSEWQKGWWLDMEQGVFTPSPPLHNHYLNQQEAANFVKMQRMNVRTLAVMKADRQQRNYILDRIIEYYALHHCRLDKIPSLEVFRSFSQ